MIREPVRPRPSRRPRPKPSFSARSTPVRARPRQAPPTQPFDVVLPPGTLNVEQALSGPYQGAAGSEAQNPGRPRVPLPDWANPSSPNYERRNYYIDPTTGMAVAREPGYYNPENPWDTGRPGETNAEYRGYSIADYERRMDEPGITPWGPGGRASKPGTFPAPPGAAQAAGVRRPVRNPLLEQLTSAAPVDVSAISAGLLGQSGGSISQSLLDYIRSLMALRGGGRFIPE